jgi:hypothetical protein
VHKNADLIGNCAGQRDDLAHAVRDYLAGELPVQIDSVHVGDASAPAFLERTVGVAERFGKVVFVYGDNAPEIAA